MTNEIPSPPRDLGLFSLYRPLHEETPSPGGTGWTADVLERERVNTTTQRAHTPYVQNLLLHKPERVAACAASMESGEIAGSHR